jgi:hypothetical protein
MIHAARTMIERTEAGFAINPERLVAAIFTSKVRKLRVR